MIAGFCLTAGLVVRLRPRFAVFQHREPGSC
jgi:hypothetical protein